MNITKEVFLSLLAADTYNRGYAPQLLDGQGPKDENGVDIDGLGRLDSKIGAATVILDANSVETDQAAGFYAVAYQVKAGAWEGLDEDTIVISYRGTDFLFDDDSQNIGGDLFNAYGIARGNTNIDAKQLELA